MNVNRFSILSDPKEQDILTINENSRHQATAAPFF